MVTVDGGEDVMIVKVKEKKETAEIKEEKNNIALR
jgi:hypothetical protein